MIVIQFKLRNPVIIILSKCDNIIWINILFAFTPKMHLEQDYKFHFLPFLGGGGVKIINCKKKTIRELRAPPPCVRCSVQVQIQIAGGLHLKKAGI